MCECTSEVWIAIPGFEGWYEVSSCGNVRSLDRLVPRSNGVPQRRRGQILKQIIDRRTGYRAVALVRGGEGGKRRVHTLVLRSFIGPPAEDQEGCHGPNGVSDNHPSNLRWDTHTANNRDMLRDGTHHSANKTACPLEHLLIAPNLVTYQLPNRTCLACQRASNTLRSRKHPDFRTLASEHYARIMAA